ncbi:MAG TPA: glycoside hydrolase family 38 C-terminal domain-containing protein [Acidimicrobiales bacterium]|nr:glycoside hydrolase family 38 C-terminal domain-containing protein [Acidimicrobiales bacterium]
MDSSGIGRIRRTVVKPAIYPNRLPLDVAAHHLRSEPIPVHEALRRPFEPFKVGDAWGGMWDTTWFRFRAVVPADWENPLALVHLGGSDMVGFSAEGLVFNADAQPVQGLHHRHREVVLGSHASGGETVLYVEAAANPVPRWDLKDWSELRPEYDGEPLYVLLQAEIADANREAADLYGEMGFLLELASAEAVAAERREEVLAALSRACSEIRPDDVAATVGAARKALAPVLSRPSSSPHRVVAVGHAHIDSAWLWPVRETKRKCARTFANQLRLLERHPHHHFVCSQAAQYKWMKDGYPEIYRQIKERVTEGRWEPVGGMWVESDSNVPSGESLVRQLVYGKRFFHDEFGIETHELWIPDVFGYSAALPQIASQAGVSSIITQKMSWNDTNQFPRSTFWWEGHDGSRILAHFPPANTYNGEFSVHELLASRDNNKDRSRFDASLYPYGYGDGGGGPTDAMLQRAALARNVEGLPRVEIGSVSSFLNSVDSDNLATWVGELYLEAHRATLTTHADVKVGNRRGEEALRAAEMWSVAANFDRADDLEDAWRLLLFNQFHDIIPGSSIGWVYEDTGADLAEVIRTAGGVMAESFERLAESRGSRSVVFNSSSYTRAELVHVDGVPAIANVAGCGWGAAKSLAPDRIASDLAASGFGSARAGSGWMENDFLRVEWDSDGLLTSVWDRKAEREALEPGQRGNLFQLHDDRPRAFDAWDVDREYLDSRIDLVNVEAVEVVESGPVRAVVRIVRRFGDSLISQLMSLTAGARRVEFHTEVDWNESHRFLKVAFPVAVRSTRATYEVQHGHIERPTIENTSWDEARFEVCGHRWADLGEPGYGVALINDCKYGYDIRRNVIRLSLLRAPGYPDPRADRGHHRFGYALLPHAGDFREAGVVEEAEWFNLPLVVRTNVEATEGRLIEIDRPGVSVEAVKWADDGDGVIVRLCEVHGSRGRVVVKLNVAHGAVRKTDLLERDREEVPVSAAGSVELTVRPFELVTLRFSSPD